MALFTAKADSNLPLLTRLFQVSSEIGSSEAELMSSEMCQFISWWLNCEKRSDTPTPTDVRRLARFAEYMRAMMIGAADRKAPPADIQQEMECYIKDNLPPPSLQFLQGDTRQGDTPIVFFTPLVEAEHGPIAGTLIRRALASLASAWERATFKRCEECESAFPSTEKKQRFCSVKCRHRHGQRRRMGELYNKKFRV